MGTAHPDCPLCGHEDTELLNRKDKTILYYCRECGHMWEEYDDSE